MGERTLFSSSGKNTGNESQCLCLFQQLFRRKIISQHHLKPFWGPDCTLSCVNVGGLTVDKETSETEADLRL